MKTDDLKIKKISFEDWDKYFKDLLSSPDDHHIIFYRRDGAGFTISTSYDAFVIVTSISDEQIKNKYKDDFTDATFDVKMDETGEDPAVVKFKAEYLSRGIPEVD